MSSEERRIPVVKIRRKNIVLEPSNYEDEMNSTFLKPTNIIANGSNLEPCSALVVNSSFSMAKEITLALTLRMPACSIMYAPTLQLARWILQRRKVDLVVSSGILPDGNVAGLVSTFEKMETPPDLVVVGNLSEKHAERLQGSGYAINTVRQLGDVTTAPLIGKNFTQPVPLQSKLKELGADLRNDLNNPLQAIVAMVFVAQSQVNANPSTFQALEAIERAAKGMAAVVNKLEDKIRDVVLPVAAA